ncbi:MAG: phosphoglycerate kinase [Thermoplasmata archaeon]
MPSKPWDIFTLDDFNLEGRTVLVRVDINSPLDPKSGRILDDYRIRSHLSTLRDLEKSKVIILAHQSRPGKNDFTSTNTHAIRMSQLLGRHVEYVDGLFESHVRRRVRSMKPGEKILLENTRFYAEEVALKGEKSKFEGTHIVKHLAPMIDFFVHDAFAASHRAQPTLVGFAELVPNLAGRVMQKEIEDMGKAFEPDLSPKIALLGGVKVEDSIDVARHMLEQDSMDRILTMGLVGQIFLMAKGVELGEGSMSFIENEYSDHEKLVEKASSMLDEWEDKIGVPKDVAVGNNGRRNVVSLPGLPTSEAIMDIGIETIFEYSGQINLAELVLINGPAGAFEHDEFSIGTTEIFRTAAHSDAYSIIGGGHSTAVLEKLDISESIDHISTGGGSCINFLAGRHLPGLEALEKSKRIFKKGPFQRS